MRILLFIPLLFTVTACEVEERPKINDKDIIAAREYVIYYEERMKKVEEYIIKCTKDVPVEKMKDVYVLCSETAYDINGFYRGENGTIHSSEKKRFQENMKISKMYLSTDGDK